VIDPVSHFMIVLLGKMTKGGTREVENRTFQTYSSEYWEQCRGLSTFIKRHEMSGWPFLACGGELT